MTLSRFAFVFVMLLAFSGMHALPAGADLIGDIKTGARKAGEAVGRGARQLGRELERGYCETFTNKSDARCRVESGVGYDKKGTYTYDPKNPSRNIAVTRPTRRPPSATSSSTNLPNS